VHNLAISDAVSDMVKDYHTPLKKPTKTGGIGSIIQLLQAVVSSVDCASQCPLKGSQAAPPRSQLPSRPG
jgi:hypothetical protein